MKIYILLSLLALASAGTLNGNFAPKFRLVADRSGTGNGIPAVEVEFHDGYVDALILNRYYPNEEQRMASEDRCHYIGHLANEQDACVAMTGCPGKEDVEFTIMSNHPTNSNMFKWKLDKSVEIIENPFKYGKSEVLLRGDDDVWTQEGDEEVNLDLDEAEMEVESLCTGTTCPAPATGLLQIRAGYDDGFKSKVGGDAQARAYIEATLPHVQASYCHASLGTKIVIQRIGSIKHYSGRNLVASSDKLKEMYDTTLNELQGADLMMYMGYDTSYYGTVGIAYKGVVCNHAGYNKYKESINEWRSSHAAAGHVIAHEIGHNIGMDHDFKDHHKAAGCDNTGIMSYGNPPNKWSHCSKSDFVAHYNSEKNNWCMDDAPKACDGSNTFTTTTTTTTTQAPWDCISEWKGDGYCDDINNHAGCSYDGGDCCNNNNPNWSIYCKECKCKQPAGK